MSTRFTIGTTHRASILGEVYEGLTSPAQVRAITYPAADGMTHPRFFNAAPRFAGEGPALNRAAARRPGGGRHPGLRLVGPSTGGPGLRGVAAQFSRLCLEFAHFLRQVLASGAAKCKPTCPTACASSRKQGIIDPKRVCIVGASYGGYAALAGVTLDSGVYRCAVSVAGSRRLAALPQVDLRQLKSAELSAIGIDSWARANLEGSCAHRHFADRACERRDGARAVDSRPRRHRRALRAKRCDVEAH